jgi:hypothetical protein
MSELQIEGFGNDITGTVAVVYCDTATGLWIPYEFMQQRVGGSRVLIHGELGAGSRGLIAAERWTQIFDVTGTCGARNWSILASVIPHLIGPVLLVITPEVVLPAAFIPYCKATTTVLFRWITDTANPSGVGARSLFFPLNVSANQIVAAQRSFWKGMPLRTGDSNLSLVLNETRGQGLHLVSSVFETGVVTLAWYRPHDSDELVAAGRRDSVAAWLGAISDRVIGLMKDGT